MFKFSVALVHRDHKDSQGGVPNSLPPSPTPPHSGGILDSLCLSVQLLSNFQLAVTTSSLGSSPAWLFFWPHCPGSFTLLQTHRHFVSATLKHKPLANTVSPTVLQSNGIHSLLTSITLNPLMLSKLTSTNNTTSDFILRLLTCLPYLLSFIPCYIPSVCPCVCVCVCVCVHVCARNTNYDCNSSFLRF